MKRLLHLLPLLALLLWSSTAMAGMRKLQGDGTKTSPYLIQSANDLMVFSNLINDGKASTISENSYVEAYARLTADIDLSTLVADGGKFHWRPIGNDDHFFKGAFWGGGHKITGLYVSADQYLKSAGLFGYCFNAEIRDLDVSGEVKGSMYAGILCGRAVSSDIAYCTTRGSVKSDIEAGGIVGCADSHGTVSFCRNYADVESGVGVGGIVGEATYMKSIDNCFNAGTITSHKGEWHALVSYDYDPGQVSNLLNVGSFSNNVEQNEGEEMYYLVADSASETASGLHASTIKTTLGKELGWTATDSLGWPVPVKNTAEYAIIQNSL